MDNGGAGGRSAQSWLDIWDLENWSATASAYNHHDVASTSCSRFPDHTVVPGSGSICCGGDHHHQHHHHLTCLKLGKRQYYAGEGTAAAGMKRERPSQAGPPPRCQVEGCNKALADAKDYHRRHKVCEAHSKAPRVVVLGAEQRFCQQCSRFHAISEFDESKRSCRRRLAGHNERRRKSSGITATSADSVIVRSSPSLESTVMGSRLTYESSPGRALSLLSSKASPWVSTYDLPSRSSAALRELIAENRATLLATQLISDRGSGWRDVDYSRKQMAVSYMPHQNQVQSQAPAQLTNGWNQFQDAGAHLTVDLMQMPGSSFDFLSGKRERGLL